MCRTQVTTVSLGAQWAKTLSRVKGGGGGEKKGRPPGAIISSVILTHYNHGRLLCVASSSIGWTYYFL